LIFPDRRDHRLKLCIAPQCVNRLLLADPALPRAVERGLDAAPGKAIDVDLSGLKAPSDSVCGRISRVNTVLEPAPTTTLQAPAGKTGARNSNAAASEHRGA
jgi:hypothetical protein